MASVWVLIRNRLELLGDFFILRKEAATKKEAASFLLYKLYIWTFFLFYDNVLQQIDIWVCGVARLTRLPVTEKIEGSNPFAPASFGVRHA